MKPKYNQFEIGAKGDETRLGPFVAKINSRADELVRLQPPMRSAYRLEPEVDIELNRRKEEKKELIAKSEENTKQRLYAAEMAALTQKAEDLLIKPTYMPKTTIMISQCWRSQKKSTSPSVPTRVLEFRAPSRMDGRKQIASPPQLNTR